LPEYSTYDLTIGGSFSYTLSLPLQLLLDTPINVDLRNYMAASEGANITLESGTLPDGLTFQDGILSGKLTSSEVSQIGFLLSEGTSSTSYSLEIAPIESELVEGGLDDKLDILFGESVSLPANIYINATLFSCNIESYSTASISNDVMTTSNYTLWGSSIPDETIEIPIKPVNDHIELTQGDLTFGSSLSNARKVSMFGGVPVTGMYAVDTEVSVTKTISINEVTLEPVLYTWDDSVQDFIPSPITYWDVSTNSTVTVTDLNLLEDFIFSGTETRNLWLSPIVSIYPEVSLRPDGTITERVSDGSVSFWEDLAGERNYSFNYTGSETLVGSWENTTTNGLDGSLIVTLDDGASVVYRIDTGLNTIVGAEIPAVGAAKLTNTAYYGFEKSYFDSLLHVLDPSREGLLTLSSSLYPLTDGSVSLTNKSSQTSTQALSSLTPTNTQILSAELEETTEGAVDISDVISQLRHIVGLSELTGLNRAAADNDANGSVDISDVISSLRQIVGLQEAPNARIVDSQGNHQFMFDDSVTELYVVASGDADLSWTPLELV